MKYITLIVLFFFLISCNQKKSEINNVARNKELQKRIKILETQLSNTYTPGFGEMMSSIQAHHSKLWFAGKNKNWQLANFEVKELNEIIEDIEMYQKDREETAQIKMIVPAISALKKSIKKQDFNDFKKDFSQLTNDCNKCHQLTDFGYNKVKIPNSSPFTNQEF